MMHSMTPSRPGYEYLTAYMLGKVIQDLTVEFCQCWVDPRSRTTDQMTQAARSNPQNIAEGYTGESLASYIKLAGVAHGSNEELGLDYEDFLRQHRLLIWPKDDPKVRKFREFRVVWTGPKSLNTPTLPNNPTEAANLMLTFCQMESYLLHKLVTSLEEKHTREGGYSENLLKKRLEYKKQIYERRF